MTDATSLNLSPSPLAALTSTGATGVVAQGMVSQGTGGDLAGGFQAMLAAQTGGANDPAPLAEPILSANPAAIALPSAAKPSAAQPNATLPAQDANMPATATPAPSATTMAVISAKSAMPIMAGGSLTGNLPLGGKILPVAEDGAEPSAEAMPSAMPAAENAKSLAAKSITAAARPRKNAGVELQQDDPQQALEKAGAEHDEEGADAPLPAATSDTPAADMMAIVTITPQSVAVAGEPEARKLATADSASLRAAAAPDVEAANMALQPLIAQGANASSQSDASQSNHGQARALPGLDQTKTSGETALAQGSQPVIAAPPAALRMADGATALPPKALGLKPGAAKAANTTSADAALAANGSNNALTSATPQDSITDRSAPQDAAPPLLREALAPLSASSMPDASSGNVSTDRSSIAAPAEGAASRDMGALVDRLVEARAAMRSGTSTQWVQTSVQHAEFGRVALQIRQDGDQLSVAMASQDPGFAPAAQAALHAPQSLLQPTPASQGSADTPPDQRSQDQRSQDQRAFGQQAQGNGNTPFGQPSSGGQDRQSPFRQQAAAMADNQRAPQPAPTTMASTTTSARSGRSGILA